MNSYSDDTPYYDFADDYYLPPKKRGGVLRDSRWLFLIIVVSHIPLALLVNVVPYLSTLHALVVFLLGIIFLVREEEPRRLIYLCAYLVGAEMFWRSTFIAIAHEFSKYAVALLLMFALLKFQRLQSADKRPIVYFVLLLPGILMMPVFDRAVIAFNLSGPFLLVVATMFFSTVTLKQEQVQRTFEMLVAPIVGTAALAVFRTAYFVNTGAIRFGNDSNRWTAGGVGPNQVATILGLGALIAFLYFVIFRKPKLNRYVMLILSVWFISQAIFTFSRGGVYSAVLAGAVATFYLLRERQTRYLLIVGVGFVAVALFLFILPQLDAFSGGTLAVRFQDTNTTGRSAIFVQDLETFAANPAFGVGVGESPNYHEAFVNRETLAHTELSRMLSEHGMLGLISILMLAWISLGRLFKKGPPVSKALIVSFTVWALFTAMHISTRMAGPSFMFGLAAATFLVQLEAAEESEDEFADEPYFGYQYYQSGTDSG